MAKASLKEFPFNNRKFELLQVLWWDIRKFGEPLEKLILDPCTDNDGNIRKVTNSYILLILDPCTDNDGNIRKVTNNYILLSIDS